MFLVFDTETSGLPIKYNLSAKYVNNWPRMVQLSWGMYDNDGKELKFYLVKLLKYFLKIKRGQIDMFTLLES